MKRLFEEYVESPEYIVSIFFKELETQIRKWFSEGSLGASGCQLIQIEVSKVVNPVQKYLKVDFNSPEYYFQIIFILNLDSINDEGEIEELQLKIKRYVDEGYQKLDRELVEEVEVEDIKEDFIIDKISELDEEEETADLKDNIYDL